MQLTHCTTRKPLFHDPYKSYGSWACIYPQVPLMICSSQTVRLVSHCFTTHTSRGLVYSSFEKGCRKKVQKCTRQSRKVLWVFSANSEKMACDTMDVCLRVLRDTNKSRFDRYSVRNVPCFESVFQLKQHFLENCQAEISPATDTTFQIGYYAKGNKKFCISSEIHLGFPWLKTGREHCGWIHIKTFRGVLWAEREKVRKIIIRAICTFCCW